MVQCSAQAWMLFFVLSFLRDHVCKNSTCDGFSLLKCKDCKRAHYCSVECQRKDWEKHQKVCEKLMYQDCWDECEKFLEILICRKPLFVRDLYFRTCTKIWEVHRNIWHSKRTKNEGVDSNRTYVVFGMTQFCPRSEI